MISTHNQNKYQLGVHPAQIVQYDFLNDKKRSDLVKKYNDVSCILANKHHI